MTQLALFDLPTAREATYIDLDILRHPEDLSDHQRGHIVLEWDTASGQKAGDVIPAWVCCVCGAAEPSEFVLDISHRCASVNGSEICHELRQRATHHPYQFRLVDEVPA